ncbi:conserved hypothetical Ustilaginaceae-specific protein [Sporisorium reilianum SRZ2]|uniref:Conserved hypothetical Ustilaginaceae-specific protein n=1 Tax=Sporisorium reilianum (strain SRZ2) TaxID=999809 RepID=E6ZTT5_SPORE|nr:conserved hypothetical Ustilaginaceae-specific protein [Sporisorium reilianum SRZ2]
MLRTILYTLFAVAVFWAAAVRGSPAPPPLKEAEAFQQYLNRLPDLSGEELRGFLQQQALRAPNRAPGAFGVHPLQPSPLLHTGFRTPPFPFRPRPNLTPLRTDAQVNLAAISADSTVVSIVPPEARLVHDTDPHPGMPILEGVPIEVHVGPLPYRYPLLPSRLLGPQHFQQLRPSEGLPANHASPSQANDVLMSESAAGPSKRQVRVRTRDRDNILKRDLYKTVAQPDPAVDAFIATLRSSLSGSEQEKAHMDHTLGREQLSEGVLNDPDSLATSMFWLKARAKGLVMQDPSGIRHLFVTFSRKPSFLPRSKSFGYIGVWELGSSMSSTVPSFFLRGFYPFTEEQYREVWTQYETHGHYWITVRHSQGGRRGALLLTIARMSSVDEQEIAARMRDSDHVADEAPAAQDVGLPQDPIPIGAPVHNSFLYRKDDRVLALAQIWRRYAGLSARALTPIDLTEEEQQNLVFRISNAFRNTRQVKVVDFSDAPSLMLCFHRTQRWLEGKPRAGMTVWKFGPLQKPDHLKAFRNMYVVGDFDLSLKSWQKLTPGAIPGLRDSTFQANMVAPP